MGKYDRYLIFDSQIPYKSLMLHPIRIRDYMDFLTLASCLTLEKNSIKDPMIAMKAISMTYLEYLVSISNKENQLVGLFVGLMALVLNRKEDKDFEITFYADKTGRPLFEIDGIKYDSTDFDALRQIIAEQNSLDLPDEKIQKTVRDAMEEARRFKERMNKSKTASFEEQILALGLFSGWDLEKIYNMTVRKFIMGIGRANHMVMSNIYLTASMSGFVTFKDKSILRGWLADIANDDKYGDVTMSLDSITKKVSGEEAKENKK